MAQPHEYVGTGANPPEGVAGESYEESYQATPFPGVAGPWVPGNQNIVTITRVSSRSITDAATEHNLSSITANPMPHVEYGRIGAN